ncbi:hypothetical protein Stsp02_19780 [Streptomyces sp. NBRC 14336]|nr:hypothetical protein Stsp02_19780 [Streptomyces sp. NBRC 14336]
MAVDQALPGSGRSGRGELEPLSGAAAGWAEPVMDSGAFGHGREIIRSTARAYSWGAGRSQARRSGGTGRRTRTWAARAGWAHAAGVGGVGLGIGARGRAFGRGSGRGRTAFAVPEG